MRYWWVSQNQTFRHEIGGGYMWSPKRAKNGNAILSYTNMTRASVGDIVFAFYQGKVQYIGAVAAHALSSSKPEEFGNSGVAWSNDGWLVPVSWAPLPKAVSPKQHIEQLRPLLPSKHSPIRANGEGNQAYLFEISHDLANQILQIAETNDELINGLLNLGQEGQPVVRALEAEIEQSILGDHNLDETEKDNLIKSRKGQGKFKSNLMKVENHCRLTGLTDKRFLIASHIKAWSKCETNSERLDGHNGFLFAPNPDKLFDNGFIGFEDNGNLMVSSLISEDLLRLLGFSSSANVGSFSQAQCAYLRFHRENTFKE